MMPNIPPPPAGFTPDPIPETEVNRIAQALERTEGANGNPHVEAPDGGYGLYQYEPKTWADTSAAYAKANNASLLDLDIKNPDVQRKVTKWQIKQWREEGFSPEEIASKWNSGGADPAGKVGVNAANVPYDAPAYVRRFKRHLSAVEREEAAMPPPPDGFILDSEIERQKEIPFHLPSVGDEINPEVVGPRRTQEEAAQRAIPFHLPSIGDEINPEVVGPRRTKAPEYDWFWNTWKQSPTLQPYAEKVRKYVSSPDDYNGAWEWLTKQLPKSAARMAVGVSRMVGDTAESYRQAPGGVVDKSLEAAEQFGHGTAAFIGKPFGINAKEQTWTWDEFKDAWVNHPVESLAAVFPLGAAFLGAKGIAKPTEGQVKSLVDTAVKEGEKSPLGEEFGQELKQGPPPEAAAFGTTPAGATVLPGGGQVLPTGEEIPGGPSLEERAGQPGTVLPGAGTRLPEGEQLPGGPGLAERASATPTTELPEGKELPGGPNSTELGAQLVQPKPSVFRPREEKEQTGELKITPKATEAIPEPPRGYVLDEEPAKSGAEEKVSAKTDETPSESPEGEKGKILPFRAQKEDVEARLKAGELVPAEIVNQFPDLAEKYLPPWDRNIPEPEPQTYEQRVSAKISEDDKGLIHQSWEQLGYAEAGGLKREEGESGHMRTTGRYGSSFPDWFSNQGWTLKDVEAVYNKVMAGKPLTPKQQQIASAMLENGEQYIESLVGSDWRDQWEALKSEHGSAALEVLTFGMAPFIEQDVVPALKSVVQTVAESARSIKHALAPASAGEMASHTAEIMRENLSEMARKGDQAEAALRKIRRFFRGRDDAANLDFIDKVERGEAQGTKELQETAGIMRQMFDERVEQVRALGTGKLQNVIQNYFPHIWKDPKKAESFLAQWFGKRPMEGSKAFLKKRSIPTTKNGVAYGLEPVSTNPVDLTLLKLREIDKYIMAHKTLNQLKEEGLSKFVRVFEKNKPDGWTKIDDRIGTVYGPPAVSVNEAFDQAIMTGLGKVADDLGITRERRASGRDIAGGRWGFQRTGGTPEVTTKTAGPESVLAHEIGHAIDDRYNVHKSLFGRDRPLSDFIIDRQIGKLKRESASADQIEKLERQKTINKELRDLADARYEGEDVTEYYKKYVRKGTEKAAVIVEAYIHAPEKFKEVAPTVFKWFEGLISKDPKLAGLKEIKPSLVMGTDASSKGVGGLVTVGNYYVPDGAAKVVNNYLSPGLRSKAWFRAYLGASNILNQAQLGFSAFHLGFTSLDAVTSKVALALGKASHGDFLQAARSFVEAPFAPVENILRGRKVFREWMSPGTQGAQIAKIVEGLQRAGGRITMDSFYKTQFTDRMIEAFKKWNIPGGVLRIPFAITEQTMKPIMEYIVPRQKLGVFMDLARYEMERLEKLGADSSQVRTALTKIWDSVDNRMGQLVYDNLFWDKTVKDLGMASVRSLGWNVGTIREIGGAGVDVVKQGIRAARGQRPELTYRMQYAIALPITVGVLGAITQYMMTGKGPEERKDYFFPKTGRKDEAGRDARLSLPSYMKDLWHWYSNPGKTAINKLNPMLGTMAEMLKNQDYFGVQIRNADDPIVKQAIDSLEYAGKAMLPFSVRGIQREQQLDAEPVEKFLPFVGVTPAPADISKSRAEILAGELLGERRSRAAITKEQFERRDLERQIKRYERLKKPVPDDVKKRMGELSKRQTTETVRAGQLTPLQDQFRRLDIYGAIRVLGIATPKERNDLRRFFALKAGNALKNAAPADIPKLQKKLEDANKYFRRSQ